MKTNCLCFLWLVIFASVAQVTGALSSTPPNDRAKVPSCRKPSGNIGESMVKGCKELVCIRKGKRALWAEHFASSVCCSYQQTGYQIGQNITTSLAEDLCTQVTLLCVAGREGDPHIQMKVDSDLCSNQDLLSTIAEDLKNTLDVAEDLKVTLDKVLNNTENLAKERPLPSTSTTRSSSEAITSSLTPLPTPAICPICNCTIPTPTTPVSTLPNLTSISPSTVTPAAEFLFLGPDFGSNSYSEILTLPSFSASNCSVPSSIIPRLSGYVATVLSDGIMICGGGYSTRSDCYLLTNNGNWLASPPLVPMMSKRKWATSVMFDNGWWVMGGVDGPHSNVATTEVWFNDNRTWVPSVNLPEAVSGHCAVKINETHLFMAGGKTDTGYSASTYIYSKGEGFVQQQSMSSERYNHACALFENNIYVAAGSGYGTPSPSVIYFSLASLTWQQPGPHTILPVSPEFGQLMVVEGSLTFFGGSSNKKIYQMVRKGELSYTWFEWEEVGELKKTRNIFTALRVNSNVCENWN